MHMMQMTQAVEFHCSSDRLAHLCFECVKVDYQESLLINQQDLSMATPNLLS